MSTSRRRADECGSGSVLVLGLCAAVCTGVLLVSLLGGAATARHRAQTAADLSALAASDVALGRRPGQPCAAAGAVAAANGGRLVGCRQDGDSVVVVTVTVVPAGPVSRLGTAEASAKAGPQP